MRRTSVTEVLGWAGLTILGTLAIAAAGALVSPEVIAAELGAAPAAAAEKSDAGTAPSAAAEKKPSPRKAKGEKPAKPRGRLPAYFGAVVTPELREKIYAIQAEYEPRIGQLRKELDALTKERDEKIHALLTPEQKKKIEELKAAARPSKKEATESKKEARDKKQAKKAANE
jgi:hypothetical protein